MDASVRASAANCLEPRYFTMDDRSPAEDNGGPLLAGTEPETTASTIASIAARPSVAKIAASAPYSSVPAQDCFFVFCSFEGFARIGCFVTCPYDHPDFEIGT
jgi:hypothetical protein